MKILEKAKFNLVLDHPFFAAVLLNLRMKPDRRYPVGATDGETLWYNPETLQNWSLEEVEAFLAHEVMHVVLLHFLRRGRRDKAKWNAAADYAVNLILKDAGFSLPPYALIDEAFRGLSAEEIYELIPEPVVPFSLGDVEDGKEASDPTAAKRKEVEVKIAVRRAMSIAKAWGKLPSGLERLIKEVQEPQKDWREVLQEFLERSFGRSDYAWIPPSRRYLAQNLILPAMVGEERLDEVVVAIDTSGSVSDTMLQVFLSELKGLVQQFSLERMWVVCCDARVHNADEFTADEFTVERIRLSGGGGTDFRPVFRWVEKCGITPVCLIYFTDTWGDFPETPPPYPVLWAVVGGKVREDIPFGEVVCLRRGA